MFKENKKKITVFICMAACIMLSVAAHKPDGKQEGFKNLQVLPKDIGHDSLIHIMQFFTRSLGVRCDFCHARSKDTTQRHPDFVSDDKPEKTIARHMMVMASEINVKYFNFMGSTMPDTIRMVTCVTCHNGKPHPENIPAPEPPRMGMPGGGPGGPGGPPPGGPGGPPPPPAKP